MAAMASSERSTLNPDAPIFVPAVYRSVEDFSPQWWDLVKSCSWFRDYWLSLHPFGYTSQDDDVFEFADDVADDDDLFPDGLLSDHNLLNGVKTDVKALLEDVIVPKSPKLKRVSPRSIAGIPKYQMRPAYHVSPKCTPCQINQPR